MTTLLDAALAFEADGCSVVPARPDGSKHVTGNIDGAVAWQCFERFHSKLYVASSGCWLWTGGLSYQGYGWFHLDGRKVAAHRLCRVRDCVNRRRDRGPTRRCPQNHPYDEANTLRKMDGRSRGCRECNRIYLARRREAARV